MLIRFTVPGEPQGKARARSGRTKSGAHVTYTPDKTVAYEELVRLRYMEASSGQHFDAPLKALIIAAYAVPKKASQKMMISMSQGNIRPTKTPDCDNIAKMVLDALNGIAYRDDSSVVMLEVEKRYAVDEPPHVEVILYDDI